MTETEQLHGLNPRLRQKQYASAVAGDVVRQLDPSMFTSPVDIGESSIPPSSGNTPQPYDKIRLHTSAARALFDYSVSHGDGPTLTEFDRGLAYAQIDTEYIQERAAVDYIKQNILQGLSGMGEQEQAAALLDQYAENEARFTDIYEQIGPDGSMPVPEKVTDYMRSKTEALEELLSDVGRKYPGAKEAISKAREATFMKGTPRVENVSGQEDDRKLSVEAAVSMLSYTDVVDAEQNPALLEYTKDSPRGLVYAKTLQTLAEDYGITELTGRAQAMVGQCKSDLENNGLKSSVYGESVSWALWDIAKQKYLEENPSEQDSRYTAADPMTSLEKMDEIVDRHVGWEAYTALHGQAADKLKERFGVSKKSQQIVALLNSEPKSNGTLSSLELAQIGRLLRTS